MKNLPYSEFSTRVCALQVFHDYSRLYMQTRGAVVALLLLCMLQSSRLCVKTLQWFMHSFQMYKCCITKTVHTWNLPGQTLQYYSIAYGMAGLLWTELLQCVFESSWPSVAFSQYQYNYPEIKNVGIIIPYSLKTNTYTCSFSCIRLRNPQHQSHWWLVLGLDNWGISIWFSTEERDFSVHLCLM